MKKLLAALCCIFALSATVVLVHAAAPSMQLIPSETQLKPGDTFYVEAKLENQSLTNYCTVKLDFDDTQLELTGGKCEVDNDGGVSGVMKDLKAGTMMSALPKKLSGTLFTFRFVVKEGASGGELSVSAKATIKKDEYMEVSDATVKVLGQETQTVAPTTGTEATEPTQSESKPARSEEPTQNEETTQPPHSSFLGMTVDPSEPTQTTDEATTQTQPQSPTPAEDTTDSRWVWVIAACSVAGLGILALLLKKKEEF